MKLFKKSFSVYMLLSLLGVICIGLGCGISIFELSEYKIVDYYAISSDADQPQLKSEVITLEAPLSGSEPFKLDATHWNIKGFDIQYDNTLTDKVLIEVTAPEGLYSVSLYQPDIVPNNYYCLDCNVDEFSMMRLSLALAKQGYIPNSYPPAEVKLIMSEAQAKNFKLNDMRDRLNVLEQNYQDEIQSQQEQHNEQLHELNEQYREQTQNMQEQYNEQIQILNEQHNERIQILNEQHAEQLENLRQQYEYQLQQKNEEIDNLNQQLNEVRNSIS